ncbi:MAG TPA: hypothetical protein VIH45_06605 [Desulfuromonadaceae bacterium]
MRILLLLLITVLTACTTVSRQINFNQVTVIREGITTQQEVMDLLGLPDRVTSDNEGNVTMSYGNAPDGADTESKFVMIVLRDDIVQQIVSSPSSVRAGKSADMPGTEADKRPK